MTATSYPDGLKVTCSLDQFLSLQQHNSILFRLFGEQPELTSDAAFLSWEYEDPFFHLRLSREAVAILTKASHDHLSSDTEADLLLAILNATGGGQ